MDHSGTPSVDKLRRAIPEHCFKQSTLISFGYLLRDVLYATTLAFGALRIPSIQSISLRILAWAVYGFLQGLVGTGIWIIAHECGHGAFSSSAMLTAFVPLTEAEFAKNSGVQINEIGHLMQDTPFMTLTRLIGHQLAGWQFYLFIYRTGGKGSIPEGQIHKPGIISDFDPFGRIFTRKQRFVVLVSDLSILIMGTILFYIGSSIGIF